MINDRKHSTARITLDPPRLTNLNKMWDSVPHGSEPIDPEHPILVDRNMTSSEWGMVVIAATVILVALCLILGSLMRFGG